MIENLVQLYRYRGLVLALVIRHLATRYRGSVLGYLWSLLNPLCLMAVYTLVFHYYVRGGGMEHYALFLFCGLLPWLWTSAGINEGTSAIVSSGHLITKSMFPAQVLPAVAVVANLANFILSLPVLFGFMLASGVPLHLTLVTLPVVMGIHLCFLLGVVLALSALNVHFRDVQHIVANALTLLFFLCPILYPVSTVPESYRFTLELNPLAGLTLLYHAVILEGVLPDWTQVVYVSAWSLLALGLGTLFFERYRESFAESL